MRLRAGNWQLDAAPERGGAILALRRKGRDILRPTPVASTDMLATACFPLVPYANRIGFGAFTWDGTPHHIPRNYPDQTHPLHGLGWLTPWAVTSHDQSTMMMHMAHLADDNWPWSFTATQSLALSATGLEATLEVFNTDESAMPTSLGFHPYFSADGVASLQFVSQGAWLVDEELLPKAHVAADTLGDWSTGSRVSRRELIDNCYTGWSGTARIERGDGLVTLEAHHATALHVYMPPDADFFCAEPVTAMPDAINCGAAAALAPGSAMRVSMRIGSA